MSWFKVVTFSDCTTPTLAPFAVHEFPQIASLVAKRRHRTFMWDALPCPLFRTTNFANYANLKTVTWRSMFGVRSRARRSFSEGWFEVQISLLSHSLLLPPLPWLPITDYCLSYGETGDLPMSFLWINGINKNHSWQSNRNFFLCYIVLYTEHMFE